MKLSVYMGSNLVGIDRYEVYDLFPNGDKIYINPLTFNEDFTACTTEVKYSFDIGDKVTSKFKLKINWFGENMIRPNVNTLMDQIFINPLNVLRIMMSTGGIVPIEFKGYVLQSLEGRIAVEKVADK